MDNQATPQKISAFLDHHMRDLDEERHPDTRFHTGSLVDGKVRIEPGLQSNYEIKVLGNKTTVTPNDEDKWSMTYVDVTPTQAMELYFSFIEVAQIELVNRMDG